MTSPLKSIRYRERHPLYETWRAMKQRTTNPNANNFERYGARGISVFPEWSLSFSAFEKWVLEHLGPRPDGRSLDRIDNEGNYEPGNLRWATRSEQQRNSRRYKQAQPE